MNNNIGFVKDAKYMLGLYKDAMSDEGRISSLTNNEFDKIISFIETRARDGFRIAYYCVQDYLNPKPIVKRVVKMLKERGFRVKFTYSKIFNSCNIIVRW